MNPGPLRWSSLRLPPSEFVEWDGNRALWLIATERLLECGPWPSWRQPGFLESVEQNGILVPVNFMVGADDKIRHWDGAHRARAAIELGLETLPARVGGKPAQVVP